MIHKEGYRSVLLTCIFFLALVLVVTLSFGVNWITLSVDVVLLGFFCFVVVKIAEVEEGEFLKSKCLQVSVFMSIWSVHVNYYPVSGDVVYSKHHQGKYLVAWHPKSSEKNERTSVGIKTDSGKMLFMRQIAGYVARRIVCYAKEGDKAVTGDQMGFIKFGSRVDFFLPLESKIRVKVGDKVRACQTVIAEIR